MNFDWFYICKLVYPASWFYLKVCEIDFLKQNKLDIFQTLPIPACLKKHFPCFSNTFKIRYLLIKRRQVTREKMITNFVKWVANKDGIFEWKKISERQRHFCVVFFLLTGVKSTMFPPATKFPLLHYKLKCENERFIINCLLICLLIRTKLGKKYMSSSSLIS